MSNEIVPSRAPPVFQVALFIPTPKAARKAAGDSQRGMIVLDKTTRETSLQKLGREFRKVGTQ